MNGYDVEVTDRALPGLHGDTICRAVSDRGQTVIVLMLTATGAPADRVTGRGLGADDYLPKPLHLPEIVLRIRSLARCKPGGPDSDPARPGPNSTRCTAPSPTTAADPDLARRFSPCSKC
jgi:DNA-binding response OmpR family regulator